jgi:hypothetical protein
MKSRRSNDARYLTNRSTVSMKLRNENGFAM